MDNIDYSTVAFLVALYLRHDGSLDAVESLLEHAAEREMKMPYSPATYVEAADTIIRGCAYDHSDLFALAEAEATEMLGRVERLRALRRSLEAVPENRKAVA